MSGLADELELAEAKVAELKRRMTQAKCIEIGRHTMVYVGGRNCGCPGGQCSVPVNVCSVCGDSDYGNNAEAIQIRQACHERWGSPLGEEE